VDERGIRLICADTMELTAGGVLERVVLPLLAVGGFGMSIGSVASAPCLRPLGALTAARSLWSRIVDARRRAMLRSQTTLRLTRHFKCRGIERC
jgi:hypothetical protein